MRNIWEAKLQEAKLTLRGGGDEAMEKIGVIIIGLKISCTFFLPLI